MTKPLLLMITPHPDDETLVGLLPLRLRREADWRVSVIPATFGSNPNRRAARKAEWYAACRILDFTPLPLPSPSPSTIARAIRSLHPSLLLFPHAADAHPRHRATHRLALAAIRLARLDCPIVESEYWFPIRSPNFLVSASPNNRTTLLAALRCHHGELVRAHYDRRFVPWMIDSVRRAAEILGRPGDTPPTRLWTGLLYRLRRRTPHAWLPLLPPAPFLRSTADLLAFTRALPKTQFVH